MEWQDNMKWEAEDVYLNGKSDFFRAYQGEDLLWEESNSISSERYLVMEQTTDSNSAKISYTTDGDLSPVFYYSKDGVNFTRWDYSEITLEDKGDKVYFYGVNNGAVSDYYNHFSIDSGYGGFVKIYGNLKALNHIDIPYLEYNYEFYFLFYRCIGIGDCRELVLPYGSKSGAFAKMFYHCDNLNYPPVIPKMDMSDNDMYYGMFEYCKVIKEITCLTYSPSYKACRNWLWNGSYNYLADEAREGNLPNENSPTFIKRKGVRWASGGNVWDYGFNAIPPYFNIIEK